MSNSPKRPVAPRCEARALLEQNADSVIAQYQLNQHTLTEIGAPYGAKRTLVGLFLKSRNVETRVCVHNTPRMGASDVEVVRELYHDQKLTMKEIGKQYGVKSTSMRRFFAKWGIATRKPVEYLKRFALDDDYFAKIDSHEKAQILGFIAADGCIVDASKRHVCGDHLRIMLHHQDTDYLAEIKKRVGYGGHLHLRNGGRHISLQIGSEKMIADLIALGITPRKSLTLRFPTEEQVPREFIMSYILGYFEGDGCISHCFRKTRDSDNKRYDGSTVSLLGTRHFLEGVNDALKEHGIDYKVFQRGNYHTLCFSASAKVTKFGQLIYANAAFVMTRKRDRFLAHFNNTVKCP